MWIYPLFWGQHIQIQIGGKTGERGNKTNKQGVRGDRTGRIFNPPNKFSEHQTVRGQEAVLIFQKGENKSTPEIELLVWPHCCASLFNPSETQHSWRHRDQEETVKPRRGLPVCAAVAWRVIHCRVSLCQGAKASLIPVPSWQTWHKPIGGPHICRSSWKTDSAKARIFSSEANKPPPDAFLWQGTQLLRGLDHNVVSFTFVGSPH